MVYREPVWVVPPRCGRVSGRTSSLSC